MNVYNNKKTIANLILEIVKRVADVDNRTRNYGTDQTFYNSEIHIVKAIMENEGIHITALAELLNVTKGTVSEVVIKLQKKGIVTKIADENNVSRLKLYLTDKGRTAYTNHEKLHKDYDELVDSAMAGEDEESRRVIVDFLNRFNEEIIKYSK